MKQVITVEEAWTSTDRMPHRLRNVTKTHIKAKEGGFYYTFEKAPKEGQKIEVEIIDDTRFDKKVSICKIIS